MPVHSGKGKGKGKGERLDVVLIRLDGVQSHRDLVIVPFSMEALDGDQQLALLEASSLHYRGIQCELGIIRIP